MQGQAGYLWAILLLEQTFVETIALGERLEEEAKQAHALAEKLYGTKLSNDSRSLGDEKINS